MLTGPVRDWSLLVQDWSGPPCSPGPVRTEDRTAVLLSPMRTAVPVPVLVVGGGPVRSSVLSPRKITSRTGTGPDPATLLISFLLVLQHLISVQRRPVRCASPRDTSGENLSRLLQMSPSAARGRRAHRLLRLRTARLLPRRMSTHQPRASVDAPLAAVPILDATFQRPIMSKRALEPSCSDSRNADLRGAGQ